VLGPEVYAQLLGGVFDLLAVDGGGDTGGNRR